LHEYTIFLILIAVIKGDIVATRKLKDPERWLVPLKELLSTWGKSPQQWELVWGDFFQLEVTKPEEALQKALEIKALLKKIDPKEAGKTISTLDVRMAIGIGEKEYTGTRISESNGPAFINAGDKFEKLKKEKINLAIQSPFPAFDAEINLYLKLAGTFMDRWTVSAAELMAVVLRNPDATQAEIGKALGIKQSAVSGRWNRANATEVLKINNTYRSKLKSLIS
jgi:hypothetical protein